ncbi:hypothetical protein BDZ94DRAFT_1311076 [Collybia nuda]|uniref:Uncharacterized protein n=1 Tax=Collybia nuda TaxID=64659 RepID=A0A9P5Y1A6_9AGAR|nr:hypothetical protein BDZ94DRAFT_1311076 [Collybia nuda]
MDYVRYLARFFAETVTTAVFSSEDIPDDVLTSLLATNVSRPLDALQSLVDCFGGSWPPEPTFKSSWPAPLQGYEATYEIIAPLLPVLISLSDDTQNREAIEGMRSRIAGLLSGSLAYRSFSGAEACPIDLEAVSDILHQGQDGFWSGHTKESTRNALLGFCGCVSFLRHSFRWGISPIVREAQMDTIVVMPPQLEVPWKILQKCFGYTSPGGCLSTCLYFNMCGLETSFRPYYMPVVGLPNIYQRTAHWDTRLFTGVEHKLFASAIVSCEMLSADSPRVVAANLKEAGIILMGVFKFFFESLNETNLARAIWLPYLQGFTPKLYDLTQKPDRNQYTSLKSTKLEPVLTGLHGLGATRSRWGSDQRRFGGTIARNSYFRRFLGVKPSPSPEIEALHIPTAQREWLDTPREHNIRKRVEDVILYYETRDDFKQIKEWDNVRQRLKGMIRQLRLWRMGHMTRMVAYEGVFRPERLRMTSGLSLPPKGEADSEAAMVEHLKNVLADRLVATR